MEVYHKYEVANCFNEYSGQRYPVRITSVKFEEMVGAKTPNGMLSVFGKDIEGHFCSLLKCYKNSKGQRYCIFGKHRLYEGFRGPVHLVGVPSGLRKTIADFGAKTE